jgi:hypothetical protein
MQELDDITGGIVDASLRIHRDLGPSLLESVYEAVLARVLDKRGFHVERQQAIRFEYEGMVVGRLINFGAATLREGCIALSTGFLLPRLRVSASPRLRVNQGAGCSGSPPAHSQ